MYEHGAEYEQRPRCGKLLQYVNCLNRQQDLKFIIIRYKMEVNHPRNTKGSRYATIIAYFHFSRQRCKVWKLA